MLKHNLSLLNFPDLVVLTESWLLENEEHYFHIEKYNIASFVRRAKRGGGILIYIKENFDYEILAALLTENDSHQIVTLVLKSYNGKDNLILTAVYNPNFGNAQNFLNDFYEHLNQIPNLSNSNTILLGDFNIDILKNDCLVLNYLSWYTNNNFVMATQTIPTRVSISSESLIDHIVCSKGIHNWNLCNIQDDNLSDHNILLLALPSRRISKSKYNHKSFINYQTLNLYFRNNPFSVESDDVDKAFDDFHKYLLDAISACSSKRNYKNDYSVSHEPWMNKDYLGLCKAKKALFMALKAGSIQLRTEYKRISNKVLAKRRELQKEYCAKKLDEAQGNPKKTVECYK